MTKHETAFVENNHDLGVASDKFGALLTHCADVVIVLDGANVVQSISVNPAETGLGCLDHWRGRALADFLTAESVPKLAARTSEARAAGGATAKPFEINHVDNANWEFPIRYTAHKTGGDDELILLGRDLRPIAEAQQQLVKTQLALDKDYEKSRDFETRYNVLLRAARDAVVILDPKTGRILDANPAAAQILGDDAEKLSGVSFVQVFEGRQRKEFLATLERAAAGAGSAPASAQVRRTAKNVLIFPSLFRSAGEMMMLCRLEQADEAEPVTEELRDALFDLFENGPDAIVLADAHGVIRFANEGFLIGVDAPQVADVRGVSLADFLVRGAVDLRVLLDNASRNGRLRFYAAKLKSSIGRQMPVEVSAVHLKDRAEPLFAFVMRDASRVEATAEPESHDESVSNVMKLVGSAPLKELVAATTDVVEKMCIETAVELTRNNRVAAAEMLGLSRQSLYVKLRKYGLLKKGDEE